jgi:hypothetical protein
MKQVDKNPIALINEFCTRIKGKINFIVHYKKQGRRPSFYCQISINSNRITDKYSEGESKQEAKTRAALEAIRVLEKEPEYRNEMINLLERLGKKGNVAEEVPARPILSKFVTMQDIIA